MPQLDSTYFLSQIFWLLLTFFLLYFFISFLILPKISKLINLRQSKIEDDLKQSELYNESAKKIQEECKQALIEAKNKAKEIVFKADNEVNKSVENKMKNFDLELIKKEKLANLELKKIRMDLEQNIDVIENDLAETIYKKLVN